MHCRQAQLPNHTMVGLLMHKMVELLIELTLGLMAELMVELMVAHMLSHVLVDMVLHFVVVMRSADYEVLLLLLKPREYTVKERKRKGEISLKTLIEPRKNINHIQWLYIKYM